MTETSFRDQIKKLVELQKIDEQIYALKRELDECPLRLEKLSSEFEEKKQKLKELDEQTKAKLLERKEREVDLKAKEDEIAKANSHLTQLKTNKEYKAKLSEIESLKADKSLIEEKILTLFDEVDKIQVQLDQEKQILSDQEKKFLEEKKAIEDLVKLSEDKIKVLDHQRKQAAVGVDAQSLMRYERILAGKDGLAMVPVHGDACTGCYMRVPPQQINEIKKHAELIFCEMCARILYIEEEL